MGIIASNSCKVQLQKIILLGISFCIYHFSCYAQTLVEKQGIRIYSRSSYGGQFQSQTAYDLMNHRYLESSAEKETINKDMVEYGDIFSNSGKFGWTSDTAIEGGYLRGNDQTLFMELNTFDYANADYTSIQTAFNSDMAVKTVDNPQVNDIYLVRLRESENYAAIKITERNYYYPPNGNPQNVNIYFGFDYKHGVINNTPPTGDNKIITTNEDATYIFTLTDFSFIDADPGNKLNSIIITDLNLSKGSLKLGSFQEIKVGDTIPVESFRDSYYSLNFFPDPNENGNNYASFDFKVNDGISSSLNTYTVTIHVEAVNDAPTLLAITHPPLIHENAEEQIIHLKGISAGKGETQGLTITASSNNSSLIADPIVSYTSDTTAVLSYTPLPGQNGTADITVTLTDDGLSSPPHINTFSRSFTVTVDQFVNEQINEVRGIRIYQHHSWGNHAGHDGSKSAYDFINHQYKMSTRSGAEEGIDTTGFYSTEKEKRDMAEYVRWEEGIFGWTSMEIFKPYDWLTIDNYANGKTLYQKNNGFDYENATPGSIQAAFDSNAATKTVENPHPGDIFLVKIREMEKYAAIKITDTSYAHIFNMYIEFSYKYTTDNITAIKKDSKINSLSVQPNPSDGHIEISYAATPGQKVDVSVIDVCGKAVYSNTIIINTTMYKQIIDLYNCPKGLYYLQIQGNDFTTGEKIILH